MLASNFDLRTSNIDLRIIIRTTNNKSKISKLGFMIRDSKFLSLKTLYRHGTGRDTNMFFGTSQ